MIRIDSNAGQVGMALRELRREFPAEFRKAMTTFAIAMEGEAGRAIRHGKGTRTGVNMGWQEPAKLTKMLRSARRKWRKSRGYKIPKSISHKFGGYLGLSVKSYGIAVGDYFGDFIGTTKNIEPLNSKFQTAEHREFTSDERRRFYLAGISPRVFGGTSEQRERKAKRDAKFGVINRARGAYSRPARDIWNTIANHPGTSDYMLRVVVGRIKSIFERRANQVVKP